MINEDITILVLSIFNVLIIAYVYYKYKMEILEKIYLIVITFGILLLLIKLIFNITTPFSIIIHYIYVLGILFSPFVLKNNILLFMSWINVFLLLTTRIFFEKCILSKYDGFNELPILVNVDRVGFIFLILITLRILKVF